LIELREAAMIAEELAREKAGHPVWIEVEFQVCSGFRVQSPGFRVQGSGFRVQGLWFRVQGLWFRFQGVGFRVQVWIEV